MNSIYDYANNVKVMTTVNGDKVITMNDAIFTELIVDLYEAKTRQKQGMRNATAHTTQELIDALRKEDEDA